MQGRTSIVIAHRLTTVEKCSRIACIEDGQIIETGSFKGLQKKGGYFSTLAKGLQSSSKKQEESGVK